jgi:hypothetical protein
MAREAWVTKGESQLKGLPEDLDFLIVVLHPPGRHSPNSRMQSSKPGEEKIPNALMSSFSNRGID